MDDEPLWSPGRLIRSVRMFFYLLWPAHGREQVWVPLPLLLRFHRRPNAEHRWREGSVA